MASWWPSPRSLRSILFAQFGAVVLAACVTATIIVAGWRLPTARQDQQREQTRIAEIKLQQLENELDNIEAVVRVLAEFTETSMQAQAAARRAAEPADESYAGLLQSLTRGAIVFDALYVVDADARILALGGDAALGPLQEWRQLDLVGLPVLRQTLSDRRVRWSEQYLSLVQGRPVVGVAVPMAQGALMAEIAVDRLGRTVLQAGQDARLLVIVTDGKGEVVASPDPQAARHRDNISQMEPVRSGLQGQSVFASFDYGGQRHVGTALRSARLGWVVLAAYPLAVAEAARDSAILITAATMLLSLGVGLYTLHRLSRQLARRLERTMGYAQDVANGRYSAALPPSGVRELEALNRDLQRMAEAIQRRERELRAIIDTAPAMAIQLYALDGRIVDWNPASAAIFGWSREQVLGRRLADLFFTARQQSVFESRLAAILADGRPVGPEESQIRCRDGSHRWLLSTTFAVHGPGDEPLFACMDVDISAMKRQEDELRAIQEKFVTFFDANPVALAVMRQHGEDFEFLDVNRAWLDLVGYSREDLLRRVVGPQRGFSIFADAAEREEFLRRLREERSFGGLEIQMRRRDGQRRRVELTLATVQVGGEDVIVHTLHDVTEKRALEQQLRELNAELEARIALRTASLAAANADLRRTLDELRQAQDRLIQTEKLASLGSLVAGVAHELNTPIGNGLMAVSTVQARLQALQASRAQGLRRSELEAFLAAVGEGCDIAVRNIGRAATLLRSFKQVAVDQSSEQRRQLDVAALIDEIVLTLTPSLRKQAIEVHTEVAPDLGMDSFPGALGQVLTNLIQNAAVHGFEGRPGGRLRLQAAASDHGHIVIRIEDDGHGIEPEALKRVFEPFYTTRLGQGGSGLGLSIVRSLVTGPLGGRIEVESQPGRGTVFTLTLPRRAPVAA